MLSTLIPLITAGFTLGLMHALDADHVMAGSSILMGSDGFSQAV
ncbi:hypothetical protein [Alkalimarinus alittae]|nr:hypothetical protein [Alkalimarinus alittae]